MSDDHKKNLKSRCRYGNCLLKETDYPVLKEVYIKKFLQLGCNISKDKSEVHPPNLCNKHKAVLIRLRKAIEENREFRPNTNIYVFKERSQSCQVCDNAPNTPGRKRKRTSKSGPDRGKLNTENVTQGDENENNALQIAIDALQELKTDGEFDKFFKTVINELPE